MHNIDPLIPVSEAIAFAGSQAKLSRILSVGKSSVNEWVSSNRDFIPPLQAWRLWRMSLKRFGNCLPEIIDGGDSNTHPLKLTA